MVDRKVSYSCLPQRGLPGRLNASDRLAGFHRARKKERARTSLLLFPVMKNFACEPGQRNRLGRTFCFGLSAEENHMVIEIDLLPTQGEAFGVGATAGLC